MNNPTSVPAGYLAYVCAGPVMLIALVPAMSTHQLASNVLITFMSPTASVLVLRSAVLMQCGSPERQLGSPTLVDSRLSSTTTRVPWAPWAPGFEVVNGNGIQL